MAKIEVRSAQQSVPSCFVKVSHISDRAVARFRQVLGERLRDYAKPSEAVADTYFDAVSQYPKANPSDLWQHVIYRAFLDSGRSDQQWKRTSGFALEMVFTRIYAPRFQKIGLRIRLLPPNEAQTILDRLGFKGQIKNHKIDCIIEQPVKGEWAVVACLHVKASLAERIQDDVPASVALMSKGLLSVCVTLDSKSFPPPHGDGVNHGELGGRAFDSRDNKIRIKRQYIENDGHFDALFSYNLRTPPSSERTPSGKRIYTLGFYDKTADQFVRFVSTQIRKAVKPKG